VTFNLEQSPLVSGSVESFNAESLQVRVKPLESSAGESVDLHIAMAAPLHISIASVSEVQLN
jgi:hypothetical protein